MKKEYLDAKEVAEIMGISIGKAYSIIRELNAQLKAQGYITIAGKVNRTYFKEKCCYGSVKTVGD